MPNIKSSERSVITDALRKAQNTSVKSAVRTASRKVSEATANAGASDAQDLLKKASSVIDKAASKGVLHKNAAARKKSRLARKVNAMNN
ncbi:MAG: 30S ribosomal protein S20 [Sporomusaceae bacterium]|nr:30S ribosomal protein S20 [Sporomusaceae bacterium]